MMLIIEFINFILYKNLKNISYKDKFKNKLEYKYLPLESVCNLCSGFNLYLIHQQLLMNAIPSNSGGSKKNCNDKSRL